MKNLKKKYILIILAIFLLLATSVFYMLSNKQERKSDTTISKSVSAWDAETASFKEYASYSEMDEERESKKQVDLEEYNRAIEGTIVEQIQNIEIPSYDSNDHLFQLEDGKIEVRSMSPMKDDLSAHALLWSASLDKNVNSFIVDDFNKDGLEDVAHIIGYTGGGSGYFYYLNIFINEQGKLKYLTQRELEDRIIIKGLKYSAGDFLLDVIAHGEGDDFLGYCCPNVPKTLTFQLQDNKLIEK